MHHHEIAEKEEKRERKGGENLPTDWKKTVRVVSDN